MEVQWLLLGIALALTGLTVSALAKPTWLVRGNPAWSACSWLAGEFAAWFSAVAFALLLVTVAVSDTLRAEIGRLTASLMLFAACGLLVVARRARRSPRLLEQALREGLGAGYLKEVPPARRLAVIDQVPRRSYLRPVPRRTRSVELTADVPYPGGDPRNVLDVYRPAAGRHDAPVLLQIHGGDWTQGHKRQQALPLVHHLATVGWVVVATNYRLAPAARMPAQLIDCKAALAWIRGHIGAFGGNPSFVAVTGGGTGAQLATLLALTFDDPELQPGFEHVDTRPAACIPLHGVYDLVDRRHRQPGRKARLRWLGENVLPSPFERDPAAWDAYSPLACVRDDAPPFFVLHGTHDALCHVEEAREFVGELRRVSSHPVVYAELDGAPHGWDMLCSPRALHTTRAITRFLEWCVAHPRACGSRLDSANRARS
jgi:acetyl esterase/lipase